MRIKYEKGGVRALTLVEILLIIAADFLLCIAALAGLLLPSLARAKAKAARINCVMNLKQIGLGFRIYSSDTREEFPWNVAPPKGTKNLPGWSLEHFRICSNEMNSPKILVCNSDSMRTRVAGWSELTDQNISYFVGLDAHETMPQTILSGDRNIQGGRMTNGNLMLLPSGSATWGKDIHVRAGNLGLGDGSAMQSTEAMLRRQLQAAELSTGRGATRLAIPPAK